MCVVLCYSALGYLSLAFSPSDHPSLPSAEAKAFKSGSPWEQPSTMQKGSGMVPAQSRAFINARTNLLS